jgi:site-specific DNA recombinase
LYIAEKQKGEIYYRCHTRNCTRGTIREELIDSGVIKILKQLELNDLEYDFFRQNTLKQNNNSKTEFEANYRRLQLLQEQITDRLSKLADAYVDGVFDEETYLQKKNQLLLEEQEIKEKLSNFKADSDEATKKLDAFLELVNSAYLSYESGTPEKKRELVKIVFSNCEIEDKNVLVKPYFPFQLMAERPCFTFGSPQREATRTFLSELVEKLFDYFLHNDISPFPKTSSMLKTWRS